MKKILLLLLIFVSGCTGVDAQQFDYGKIAPHPRLLLPAGGEEAIRKAIAEYPPLATVHQRIMELCDRTLTEPPVERIKEGKRLLAISRIALKRIYYLSYADGRSEIRSPCGTGDAGRQSFHRLEPHSFSGCG